MESPLDMFGVDPLPNDEEQSSLVGKVASAAVPTLAGALAALLARRSHPLLTFLGVSAIVGNAQEVYRGERTLKEAAQRVGRHVVATAASLATPSHPGLAYVAGAFAAELLIDGKGNGILDEWAQHIGVDVDHKPPPENKEETGIIVREKKS